jgi:hypothetical protein
MRFTIVFDLASAMVYVNGIAYDIDSYLALAAHFGFYPKP